MNKRDFFKKKHKQYSNPQTSENEIWVISVFVSSAGLLQGDCRNEPVSVDGGDRDVVMSVRPVGFNESVSVRIRQMGVCGCAQTGAAVTMSPIPRTVPRRPAAVGAHCSGRGVCTCGRVCVTPADWDTSTATSVRWNDFSCPYVKGLVCGGERRDVCEGVTRPAWLTNYII